MDKAWRCEIAAFWNAFRCLSLAAVLRTEAETGVTVQFFWSIFLLAEAISFVLYGRINQWTKKLR